MLKLAFTKQKRYRFTSKFNSKLFKKYLSLKCFSYNPKKRFTNIFMMRGSKVFVDNLKRFYNRREFVAFRLLRFFSFFDYFFLRKQKVAFLLTHKFSVYNGKKTKPINIQRGNLERILRCNFRFGSFVFTRAFYLFRRQKRKKNKGKKK